MPITLSPKTITITPNYQIAEVCLNAPFDGERKCLITVDSIEQREDGDVQQDTFQKEFALSDLLSADSGSKQLPWLSDVLQSRLPKGATLHHVSFQTPRLGTGKCNMVFDLEGHSSDTNIPIADLMTVDGAKEFYIWFKTTLYAMLVKSL